MGDSYDRTCDKKDLEEPARIVEGYIQSRNAKNVLELAYGLGVNIAFLVNRNPDVTFEAIDLGLKL